MQLLDILRAPGRDILDLDTDLALADGEGCLTMGWHDDWPARVAALSQLGRRHLDIAAATSVALLDPHHQLAADMALKRVAMRGDVRPAHLRVTGSCVKGDLPQTPWFALGLLAYQDAELQRVGDVQVEIGRAHV